MGETPSGRSLAGPGSSNELARAWRRFGRFATSIAILTAPVAFFWYHRRNGWDLGWSILLTVLTVAAFRGLVDVVLRRLIPWPTLFGVTDPDAREEDVVGRRRAWFWRFWFRVALLFLGIITLVWAIHGLIHGFGSQSWPHTASSIGTKIGHGLGSSQLWIQVLFVFFLFLANILLFMGPMMMMGISQIRGFEPGDADWGVRLEDVRGQAEAKEEVRRVVTLWQSGEFFERAGGKRERGLLFFGAPGTGKTMLAKAIATGFNCPIVTIPGSGFAQTFIGVDALIVRWLAWKSKRLARKWGGQCIVFIDEIDAVGRRRAALGSGLAPAAGWGPEYYGRWAALNPSGDLVCESREWREHLFRLRAPEPRSPYPPLLHRMAEGMGQVFPGMFGGGMGQLALNQLLVVMDGMDNPPFWRRFWTNKTNSVLDALYFVPRKLGALPLRVPKPKPRKDQIYFIGATNVDLEALDPALLRPGRMGRHVFFRTPTKNDRKDIFDLYLGKVSHDSELDAEKRREEISRITSGYSPAMIDQVCSMALTIAHHDGRPAFTWNDLLEAMVTVEAGMAIGFEYTPQELRQVAIHEVGHAVTAHVYASEFESTRISVRRRGDSGGHHWVAEREERFVKWRHEELGRIIWSLGSMAAEYVFYGENTQGVGGDISSATRIAAQMVGGWGMAPSHVELNGNFPTREEKEEARKRITRRFEEIGIVIMRRMATGPNDHESMASVLGDRDKRQMVTQFLGQAFMAAYFLIQHNRAQVEWLAEIVMERKEIYGDELVQLLDSANLQIPYVDLLDETVWPTL